MPANPDSPAPSATTEIFPLSPTRQTWLIYALVLVAVSWACFGSLADHLLDTHDDELFRDSAALSKDLSFFFAPAAEKAVGSGRPLADLVESLPYLVWGPDPARYHLFVVFLHTLASLLLAYVAWQLGMSLELSLAGGLLFLINVAHFQGVHWISGMDYPVALLVSLGAALCCQRYYQAARPAWFWAFCAALPLGALAHPAALMVWPFCLYWAWSRQYELKPLWRTLPPLALLMVPTLAFISYTTAKSTSTYQALGTYSLANLPGIAAGIVELLLWFSSRLLTTAHWTAVAVYQQQTWELGLGLAVLAALGVLVWKRVLPPALWAVWTALMLLPFLVLTEEVVRDLPAGPSRYLYLATAGSSFLLAWLLQQGSLRLAHRIAPRIPYTLGLLLLLVSSFIYLKKAEALTFYTSGRNYIALGNTELGARQLQRAIDRDADQIPLLDAYSRLCLQLMGTDSLDPALGQALARFPADLNLNLFQSVILSLGPEAGARQQAGNRLVSLVANLQGERQKNAELVIFQAYANYGLHRSEQDDFDRAIPALRRALEYNPGSIKIHRRLVMALMNTGQIEEATFMAEQALRLNPEDPGTPGLRALVLRLQGKTDEAIAVCRAALAERPMEDLFALLGECYEHQGDLEQARQVYQQCLGLFPNYLPVRQRLAELSILGGDRPSAIAALEKAIQLDPTVATNYYNLGNMYYSLKRLDQAAAAYQEAIRRGFRDPKVYANLGTALRGLDRLPEAAQAYREAIALQPGNPTFHHNLGGVAQQQGDRQGGITAFREATRLGSDNIETYLGLSQLYQENGQLDEALQVYSQILGMDLKGGSSELYNKMGTALFRLGKLSASTNAYRKALAKDSTNLVAHVNLGWNYYLQGAVQEAISHYRQALAVQPNSQAQFSLGLAYLRLGQLDQARQAYAEGVKKYGAPEGRQVGAVDDLKQLIAQGIQTAEAQRLLDTYWQ
ncbi:MAG: tetratricopeptide repeat protein [Candidatus Latescibacteria bacterium]|nr:tetratricopeptide repeat protein [Candidatus Latescibacterota bacterium]